MGLHEKKALCSTKETTTVANRPQDGRKYFPATYQTNAQNLQRTIEIKYHRSKAINQKKWVNKHNRQLPKEKEKKWSVTIFKTVQYP